MLTLKKLKNPETMRTCIIRQCLNGHLPSSQCMQHYPHVGIAQLTVWCIMLHPGSAVKSSEMDYVLLCATCEKGQL